jgi:hypothetical protein
MKKLISIVLLLFTTSCFAQQWSIGVNAGGVYNSKMHSSYYNIPSSVGGGAFTLSVHRRLNAKWQIGWALDYQRMASRVDGFNPNIGFCGNEIIPPAPKGILTLPVVSWVMSINRIFTAGKFEYYLGTTVGNCVRKDPYGELSLDDYNYMWETKYPEVGLRAGFQLGGNYMLSRHWFANAEFGSSFYMFGLYEPSCIMGSVGTVGVHYTF